ncbi:MAG: hypothetical protein IKP65_04790, partial [Alphaproteobacteria bacterium]|nr:hypothetical protein [Alphaproteobacteria bacterium]
MIFKIGIIFGACIVYTILTYLSYKQRIEKLKKIGKELREIGKELEEINRQVTELENKINNKK